MIELSREQGAATLTAGALLVVDDRPKVTLNVPAWGDTSRIVIRALSLSEQVAIRHAAARALSKADREAGITEHFGVFCLKTLRYGVFDPPLDDGQTEQLASKNGIVLNKIVEWIWQISATDWKVIDALTRELAGGLPEDASSDTDGNESG